MTSKVISNRIKARKSKSTEQYDCKLFFRLDGTCNSIVELSAEILSRRSNLTPQRAKNTVNDVFSGVCGTEVAFDIEQVGFTVSSLFFPRPASYSRQFTPLLLNTLRKKRPHEVGPDRYLGTFIRKSAKLLT